MIHYLEGQDLFTSTAQALVNPVNCVGVMGKGIAKEFAKRFPECLAPYKEACTSKALVPGAVMMVQLSVYPVEFAKNRPAIVLFPTKDHWKSNSRLEWIASGLKSLVRLCEANNLTSVALPQLGCGLGGLKWNDVRTLFEQHLRAVPADYFVFIKEAI